MINLWLLNANNLRINPANLTKFIWFIFDSIHEEDLFPLCLLISNKKKAIYTKLHWQS